MLCPSLSDARYLYDQLLVPPAEFAEVVARTLRTGLLALLLGARTLLGAKGLTTSSKDATNGAPDRTTTGAFGRY